MRDLIDIVKKHEQLLIEAEQPDMSRRNFLRGAGKVAAAGAAVAAGLGAKDAKANTFVEQLAAITAHYDFVTDNIEKRLEIWKKSRFARSFFDTSEKLFDIALPFIKESMPILQRKNATQLYQREYRDSTQQYLSRIQQLVSSGAAKNLIEADLWFLNETYGTLVREDVQHWRKLINMIK